MVEGKNSDEISELEKILNHYINTTLSVSSLSIGSYHYNLPKKIHQRKNNKGFSKNFVKTNVKNELRFLAGITKKVLI